TRRRPDAMPKTLAPPGHARIGVDAHEQHVDAGARLASLHRHRAIELHRHIDDDGFDFGDLHSGRCPLQQSLCPTQCTCPGCGVLHSWPNSLTLSRGFSWRDQLGLAVLEETHCEAYSPLYSVWNTSAQG